MVSMETQGSGATGREEYFATADKPFHFTDCGLDNVYLIGIRYFRDSEGRVSAEIPAVKQLMQRIAQDVVSSPSDLSGKELRFLRKRLGKRATEFCQYLGIEPETLSRMENERQPISVQVQKLARLSYCVFSEDHSLAGCAQSILLSMLEDERKKGRQNIVLEMDTNQEWNERRAA